MSGRETFYLETFGCQMNVVDSERIVDLLQELGYRQVETPEAAGLILLNTCSVRGKAERRVYGHLGRFKPLKDADPALILAVGGCVAQQEGAEMLRRVPYLDFVFGTHNIHQLPEMLRGVRANRTRSAATEFLDRETRLRLFPRRSRQEAVTRFVTVMQGCDNFCSYCVVPLVRGREVSRPAGEILAEVRQLAAQGAREITLLGQNVNSYGRTEPGEISFARLLERVAAVEGVERIRFTTSHPRDLSDDLIACFGRIAQLCHHLHLPVQSGSDRILKAMNRGYTAAAYLALVDKLRAACPDIRLTSDVIVGFPGETEEDLAATLALVEQVRYADAYTFLYSPRPGTAAATLADDLPAACKQERFDRLVRLQTRISAEIWAGDTGTLQPVLVEGRSRKGGGQLFGRTTWNRIVNFDGDPALIGQTVLVRIERSYKNSQLGRLAEGETQPARLRA